MPKKRVWNLRGRSGGMHDFARDWIKPPRRRERERERPRRRTRRKIAQSGCGLGESECSERGTRGRSGYACTLRVGRRAHGDWRVSELQRARRRSSRWAQTTTTQGVQNSPRQPPPLDPDTVSDSSGTSCSSKIKREIWFSGVFARCVKGLAPCRDSRLGCRTRF